MLENYLTKTPKKQLIFDLDETITTLLINWSDHKKGLIDKLISVDPSFKKHINPSLSSVQIVNRLVKQKGQKLKNIANNYSQNYEKKFYSGHSPNNKLISFIKNNTEQYQYFLWTNNQRLTAELVLKEMDIFYLFDKIVSATDTLFYKPDKEGFYLFFDDSKHRLEDFLMIGDSKNDRLAAKNSNIDFLDVNKKI